MRYAFRMDHKKNDEHAGEFRNDGSNCCTVEAHFRETPFAKNKRVIEQDICQRFCKRTCHQVFTKIDAYEKCVTQLVNI